MFRSKCTQPGVGSVSIFADPTLTETSKAIEMSPVLHQDISSTCHLYLYFVMFPGNTDCLRQVEIFHNQINQWFSQSSVGGTQRRVRFITDAPTPEEASLRRPSVSVAN